MLHTQCTPLLAIAHRMKASCVAQTHTAHSFVSVGVELVADQTSLAFLPPSQASAPVNC
jgi:hypothetical protein